MSADSRKRPAEVSENGSVSKRQRLQSPYTILSVGQTGFSPYSSVAATVDELGKKGLRRGIALALQKVGFGSAEPEAMESFTLMAETYLTSLAEDVRTFMNTARRPYPIPSDFDLALSRFNLTKSSLEPHIKPPIRKSKRRPAWEPLTINDPLDGDLPILGNELDGAPEKAAKQYIPGSFPAFPSIHTFKHTPEDVAAVTVSEDWGAFNPDAASQTLDGSQTQPQPVPQRPLPLDEIPHGDPKKVREAAAKEAKAGEGALRRLMRASKIAKQKEVWSAAQRQPVRRERYNLWEAAMRELIEDETRFRGKELASSALHGDKGRFEIADHSMIVNWEKRCCRQDLPRTGVRKATSGHGG
ncbi:hypothetical protein N657DRAFT_636777 [Parathielavia appendiculata]|uniref:Transcription initiation factor TFIID subunit 8 n=1 Tax=Parathielavia appendiculata TaxID=2587402 RepID=A0AAN6Z081_9PEZI|nr:hypothetical protein N657DRAFT_636777 [Parathielavia appendiculata]